jgi:hypothetical protein
LFQEFYNKDNTVSLKKKKYTYIHKVHRFTKSYSDNHLLTLSNRITFHDDSKNRWIFFIVFTIYVISTSLIYAYTIIDITI